MLKYKSGLALILSTTLLMSACGGSSSVDVNVDNGSNEGGGNNGSGSNSGGNNGGSNGASLQDQQAALSEIAATVISTAKATQPSVTNLNTAITSYCNALETSSNSVNTSKQSAQDAWRSTINAWQKLEMMNFGPANTGINGNTGGNSTPRMRIYSWPSSATCFVDRAVVEFDDAPANFVANNQDPREIGLDAMEYLLFNSNLNHTCSSDNLTNSTANGAWDDRTDSDRNLARCNYSKALAADVETQLNSLVSTWDEGNNKFSTQLSTAGSTSTIYSSAVEALNEVSDALFYLDTQVKDRKLAEALGIGQGNTANLGKIESQWANNSMTQIKANLEGFKAILNAGFDDLLADADLDSVATDMNRDLDAAIANINTFINASDTLAASITGINAANCTNSTSDNRLVEACAIHADIKKITDNLKTDFVTALSLAIPQSASGDND